MGCSCIPPAVVCVPSWGRRGGGDAAGSTPEIAPLAEVSLCGLDGRFASVCVFVIFPHNLQAPDLPTLRPRPDERDASMKADTITPLLLSLHEMLDPQVPTQTKYVATTLNMHVEDVKNRRNNRTGCLFRPQPEGAINNSDAGQI